MRLPALGAALLAVAAMACAAPPRCPSPAAVVPVRPMVFAAPPSPPATPAASGRSLARRPSPCWARGAPRPRVTKAADPAPSCAPLDGVQVSRVEARLRKELPPRTASQKLVVDFGCDRAAATTRALVYERGSGHGGTLDILHARWEEGGRVVVRRISSRHYGKRHFAIEEAEMSSASLEAILEASRVALLARPHVLALRLPPSSGLFLGSFSVSSNDVHRLLRIEDENHDVTEGAFTGYLSSHELERFLPLQLATEPLEVALDALPFSTVTMGDEDRELFADRFLATMSGAPFWWVQERYVSLATVLGSLDVVPALVTLAQAKKVGSEERTRVVALEAIANLTGWDPRVDADGSPVDVDAAARAAAEACAQ